MDIKDLQKQAIVFRDKRDWKKYHNPKDLALSLNLEASELLEHFQWINGAELEKYTSKNKKLIADELMDILYWFLIMTYDLKIDISKIFRSKMGENAKKYPVKKVKGLSKKYSDYK